MLPLPVSVYVLDRGLPSTVKGWWHALRAAQLHEVHATFGAAPPCVDDYRGLDALHVPSVVVIPALAGGCVRKTDWWPFRHALRRYRARGGVAVILGAAFCLSEEGQKSAGRNFQGIQTSGGWAERALDTPVSFSTGHGPLSLPIGFTVDHRIPSANPTIEHMVTASSNGRTLPLVARYADRQVLGPGAMLFVSTWGRMRRDLLEHKRGAPDAHALEPMFQALREVNRQAITTTVDWVLGRMSARMSRLEGLSGERERLSRVMGSEKDYQRLLANDFDLCLDLVTCGGDPVCKRLRESLVSGWTWAEPPHRKPSTKKGRLDLLLLPREEATDCENQADLEAWLGQAVRGPVAWVELEAHGFDAAQMNAFYIANRPFIGPHDVVVAVDRSPDHDPGVIAFATALAASGVAFIHVTVPDAFERLEDAYAPLIHRTLRKRYTSEAIRGLIG